MLKEIHTSLTASISEFRKAPMSVLEEADGQVVAVLSHNKPAFYCVPAEKYDALMELLENKELLDLYEKHKDEPVIEVSLGDL